MSSTSLLRRLALAFALLLLATVASSRQQQATPPTIDELRTALAAVEASDAPEAERTAEADLYRQAIDALTQAEELRARAVKLASQAAEAPELAKQLRAELETAPAAAPEIDAEGLTLDEVETRLETARAELAAHRLQLSDLEQEATRATTRKAELPKEVAAALAALNAAEESAVASQDDPQAVARRALRAAQLEQQTARLTALETERDTLDTLRELTVLRRDRALRRVARNERMAGAWQEVMDARRAAEGEAAAARAGRRLEDVMERFPTLAKVAARTHELAALRSGDDGLPARLAQAQADLVRTRSQLLETETRYRQARRRITAGGLTEGMGVHLRRDREWLPSERDLRKEATRRKGRLSKTQLEQIALEEERREAGDPATELESLLAGLGQERTPELEQAALELLTAQREALDAALGDLSSLQTSLFELEELSTRLTWTVEAYGDYIEQRILWVRSSPANPLVRIAALPGELDGLGNELLQLVPAVAATRLTGRWVVTGLLVGVAVVLLAVRSSLKRRREERSDLVRSYRTDAFRHTLRGMVQTFLLALPFPAIAWILGWLLAGTEQRMLLALSDALRRIAGSWLVLRFVYEMVSAKGVAQVDFRWGPKRASAVRREIRWFEPAAIALGLIVLTLESRGVVVWSDSIGRAAFLVDMGLLATLLHRLLRSKSEIWGAATGLTKGLLGRTHRLWSVTATLLPVGLGLLAIAGYYYTALQLEIRLRSSIGFLLALVLLDSVLARWLFITRRRLAISQALEAKAREREGEESGEGTSEAVDVDKIDIPAVDAQTRTLFKNGITLAAVVGLFLIWAGVLPALQGLDRVQLLPKFAILDEQVDPLPSAGPPVSTQAVAQPPAEQSAEPSRTNGSPVPGVVPSMTPSEPSQSTALGLPATLTLADLLLASVFALLTWIAAKNLPALLELALLARLPLDTGARFAIATVVRYLIVLAGVSIVSKALGVGWQHVQWLAAALTFGLAFGLQEIFANFVSGLIILAERPIRVGDIVTVGQIEGRVTQLRMRATTIQDYDRRELLVPNKAFITDNVVNWTLSDPVTRLVIKVGVAYGSDTKKAQELLLQVARSSRLTLDDPPSRAFFLGFGDSSLDFELRVFIARRDDWAEVTHDLHFGIDQAFRKAGIEIAFPQRDIHVRSVVSGAREALAGEEPGSGA